jgi:4-amino-4-deoxy-L-arabinose transferase-like glycosyltransferase
MEFITGAVYSIFGATLFGGFLFFSFLAFIAAVLFVRAFMMTFPRGNHRLFAILVFLFPTIVFWPSSVGKDAVMFFSIGLASYGVASVFMRPRFSGYLLIVLATVLTFLVRPHFGIIFGAALGLAAILHLPIRTPRSLLLRFIGAIVGVIVVFSVLNLTARYFRTDSLSPFTVLQLLAEQAESEISEVGSSGSVYEPTPVSSPLWVPSAIVTVLFRPFPWEAHNPQSLVEAGVAMVLLLLVVWKIRPLVRNLRAVFRSPYALYSLWFVVLMVLVISTLSNFGVVARERSVVLPFLFLFLTAVPAPRRAPASAPANAGPAPAWSPVTVATGPAAT